MRVIKNSFFQSVAKGRTGEQFVLKHLDALLDAAVLRVTDTTAEHSSGKDLVATVVRQDDGAEENRNVEVKTVWGFLSRTNDEEDPSGTLSFELWKSGTRSTPGWLDEMIHPETYPNAVCPDVFIFLLVAYENAFASVAFERTAELINRLKTVACSQGFDLDQLPCGEGAQDWQPANAHIEGNMWLVSFGLLEDLATVTMIGDKPRERPDIISGTDGTKTCMTATQSMRYQRLAAASKDRQHMAADEEFIRRFTGNDADHVFSIIDQNLNTLYSQDFKGCFSNLARYNGPKGRVLDSLEAILLSMLAHEYPSREAEGTLYFPISYQWLAEWSRKQGVNRALKTWYANIKLAIVFGLLGYFRPPRNSEHPVDIAVNANNTGVHSVGYYTPVELTRERLLWAEYNAQRYYHDKVKTSEITKNVIMLEEDDVQKVHRAYGDKRIVSVAVAYVQELFKQTIFDMVNDAGFALPADVCKKVRSTMVRMKRLWHITPEDLLTDQGRNEAFRQRPYWKEYHRLEKNMNGLAKSLYFVYKQLSEEDKAWLEGAKNLPTGTRIIRLRDIPDWCMDKVLQYRNNKREAQNAARRLHYKMAANKQKE